MTKRTFYLLLDDVHVAGRWHLGKVEKPKGALLRLMRAEPVAAIPLSVPVSHEGSRLDYTLTSFAVPIVTRELAGRMASVTGTDVQFVPVEVAGTSMCIINPLRRIRCLDEQSSHFSKFEENDPVRPDLAGEYRSISRVVLDEALIPHDAHCFLISGSTVHIIVSDALEDAVTSGPHVGARFVELATSRRL